MKHHLWIIVALLCILLLPACGSEPAETVFPESPPSALETEPSETTLPETVPVPTVPEHSELYLPGVDVEIVLQYFNEVCLDAEFVNSGNPQLLQKWMTPIRYSINGACTEEDRATLSSFVQWLNTLDGFPGISEADSFDEVNLQIHFCTQPEMLSIMGEQFYGLDGAVTFWYDFNEIYNGIICCRTDIPQYTRNSVILEELYNCLGPIQDTSIRPDSIIYSEFSEPQNLTQMDELILKLLYHPRLVCGMDAESCAAEIRNLYY